MQILSNQYSSLFRSTIRMFLKNLGVICRFWMFPLDWWVYVFERNEKLQGDHKAVSKHIEQTTKRCWKKKQVINGD